MSFSDFVACYAAIVATCAAGVAVWQVLRTRRRLKITAKPNMSVMNGDGSKDDNTYIVVSAINIGPTPLTISHLFYEKFSHPHMRIGNRREEGGISKQPTLPAKINPGDEWVGLIIQNDEISQDVRAGKIWVTVHSPGAEGRSRVQVK